jgi:hypothetical protein
MGPRTRKIALTAHVATSVGWLGAAYTMVVLTICGLVSTNPALRLACYEITHLFDEVVNIPLGLSMLTSGLIVSLGTKWGLVKYRWVLTKFVVSTALLVLIPVLSVPRLEPLIHQLQSGLPVATGLAVAQVAISLGTVAALTVVTTISVFKPWGRTRWGRR